MQLIVFFCDFLKRRRKIRTHAAMDFLMPSLVAIGTNCSNAIDSTWRGLSVLNPGSIQGGITESSERKNKTHAIERLRAAPRGENEHGETTGMGERSKIRLMIQVVYTIFLRFLFPGSGSRKTPAVKLTWPVSIVRPGRWSSLHRRMRWDPQLATSCVAYPPSWAAKWSKIV